MDWNVGGPIPVEIVDKTTGNGVSGVTYDEVTVWLAKNGGADAARTLTADEWVEAADGCYWFVANATDANTKGWLMGKVKYTNAYDYPFAVEVVDPAALLKLNWTGLTGEAAYSMLNALRLARNKFTIVDSVLTVFKEDGLTTAFTATLASDVAADPIVSSTPV